MPEARHEARGAREMLVTDNADDERRHAVRHDSDELLDRLGELRDLEVEKRGKVFSTKPFHDLADEITEKSREVFRIAAHEELAGEAITLQGSTIDDEEATA
jgi:hypothetical protein